MEPSLDFVDNHATVYHREAEIELGEETLDVGILLSEGGQLSLEPKRPRIDTRRLETGIYPEVTGTTEEGEQVIITDLFCFADELISLSPQVIEICRNPDKIVEGEEITLHADVLGFQYKKPTFFDSEDRLELLERTDWRVGGGNFADWKITVKPLPDYEKRVSSIQNYHNFVRTVQFEILINGVYGGLNRVAAVTDKILDEITWLSSFVQGTLPSYSKLEINAGEDPEYLQLRSLASNVGGCCRRSHLLLFMPQHELPIYLSRGLKRYPELEDKLELRKILGFYVDSLHPSRPVDARFTNLCIATEMLAKKHLPDQGSTPAQIKALVEDLDVQFMDLIPEQGSLRTQLDAELGDLPEEIVLEYFWFKSRNHVIHGGRNVTTKEIIRDYQSLLILLRRMLRELLLGSNTNELRGLNELEPEDFISL